MQQVERHHTDVSTRNLLVISLRMKDAIDRRLRDEQAGFRKEHSCTDQITTHRIMMEQTLECKVHAVFQPHRFCEGKQYKTLFNTMEYQRE